MNNQAVDDATDPYATITLWDVMTIQEATVAAVERFSHFATPIHTDVQRRTWDATGGAIQTLMVIDGWRSLNGP